VIINMTDNINITGLDNLPIINNPEDLLNLEETHRRIAAKVADQLTIDSIKHVHSNDEFVKDAVKMARENGEFPLINKGWRPVTIILLGGSKVTISTPYLRIDWKKKQDEIIKNVVKKVLGCIQYLKQLG
jgi:hypothetical protein